MKVRCIKKNLFNLEGPANVGQPPLWLDPSRASTCADICLKLSLLSSPAVPHFICLSALGFHPGDEGPRCSAMRCSTNPPSSDTWQIINGGPAALIKYDVQQLITLGKKLDF